jgi:hypothetical protein
MLNNGEDLFKNAQQAREVLLSYGFTPLCRLGAAEHWVRGPRRCILAYEGEIPSVVPLGSATHVWFVGSADPDDLMILATF